MDSQDRAASAAVQAIRAGDTTSLSALRTGRPNGAAAGTAGASCSPGCNDRPVAAGQLTQQLPPHRLTGQAQELQRSVCRVSSPIGHKG